jgi:hypothetical protein
MPHCPSSVIQQTVAHLGELDARGGLEARATARHLIGTPEQAGLFDDGKQHLTMPVRLKGVRIERSRRFGDVPDGLQLAPGPGQRPLAKKVPWLDLPRRAIFAPCPFSL